MLVKKDLEARLAKYEVVAPVSVAKVPLVEQHLRKLMTEVTRLKNRLAAHRPALASKYVV
jgi:hypothetical protein